MESIFDMDRKDLKKLQNFMRNAPREFQRATAGVLNSLAFKTVEHDYEVLSEKMIIRDPRFVKGSLRVDKAKPGRIESQVAYASSIKRPRFSGWEEQQEGTTMKRDTGIRKRIPTRQARGGSVKGKIKPNMRINNYRNLVKPSQFGNNFQFMMRVLGSRGGGYINLDRPITTKGGKLTPGIYRFKPGRKNKKGRFDKIQEAEFMNPPRRYPWRTISITRLKTRNNIKAIWAQNISHILQRHK